jgi:DNA-binding NtrC family response regulator
MQTPMSDVRRRTTDGARILVVEDHEDFRLLLETVLTQAGFVVDCAESSEDAVAMLEQGDYDFLLSDYCLPGHSGAWLVAHANERTPESIPSLIVTGDPDAPGIPHDHPVVPKPVDFDRLLTHIRETLAETAPVSAKMRRAHAPLSALPSASRQSSSIL